MQGHGRGKSVEIAAGLYIDEICRLTVRTSIDAVGVFNVQQRHTNYLRVCESVLTQVALAILSWFTLCRLC